MKRLIVLCDGTNTLSIIENSASNEALTGTGQDSTNANPHEHPTNVTRLSRALSPYAVSQDGSLIQQIVFYQPGVGTNLGDKLRGGKSYHQLVTGPRTHPNHPGIYGAGLSAHIRAAYGFLCHNWEEGDEIFLFGYSRGAYTARSIAGLATSLGLLSKRGMDQFARIYDQYYNHSAGQLGPNFDQGLLRELRKTGDLRSIGNAIQVIGVWDTVGFHGAGITGEKIEFYNQRLSPHVQHAYQALSLDEHRPPFQPTLWEIPRGSDQDLQQVWFSGVHADIGGGGSDSRLAHISLAWMIARCAEDGKLAFIDGNGVTDPEDYYLLDHGVPVQKEDSPPWDTAGGSSAPGLGLVERGMRYLFRMVSSAVPFLGTGVRAPMVRVTKEVVTNERIHCSIRDRNLSHWPCEPLSGKQERGQWGLARSVLEGGGLEETGPTLVELRFKGRIRQVS